MHRLDSTRARVFHESTPRRTRFSFRQLLIQGKPQSLVLAGLAALVPQLLSAQSQENIQ